MGDENKLSAGLQDALQNVKREIERVEDMALKEAAAAARGDARASALYAHSRLTYVRCTLENMLNPPDLKEYALNAQAEAPRIR